MKHFPVRIKAILVPHDGTLAGDKALSYAVQMAKTTGATIYLLHIIESPPIAPVFILTKQEKKRLEKGIQDELTFIKKDVSLELKERVDYCKSKGINANHLVVIGTPENEIIRHVKKFDIDLIVMAKRRKIPGIKGILKLGSVSRKILEAVKQPVLVIET